MERFGGIPKNILGEEKESEVDFGGMLCPELHGCCLGEIAGGDECHQDPQNLGLGRETEKKKTIKEN